MKFIALLILLFTPFNAFAAEYEIDYAQSKISFSGTHAGNKFTGVFEQWNGMINFDPNDLTTSYLNASFDLSTAKTGNKMYDGTLPQSDWFDVKNNAEASFESTAITANEDGTYKANGELTLRGITAPVEFNFTLSDLAAAPVLAKATFDIDRFAYDLGKKSDPSAEWVSQNISLSLEISANPK